MVLIGAIRWPEFDYQFLFKFRFGIRSYSNQLCESLTSSLFFPFNIINVLV